MTIAGFFSERIKFQLPHPALDISVLIVAHEAICFGLKLLRDKPPAGFDLTTALEDQITRQLHFVLENRVRKSNEVAGFDERVFRRIWRAPEFTNVDGNHPAKKPDLVFELARDEPLVLSSHDGLFVECKPVGDSHSVSKHYCEKGAVRFLNGDYAWAMQEGLMLAYVRNGYTIGTHLTPVLTAATQQKALGLASKVDAVVGSSRSNLSEALHVTTHTRSFAWPQRKGAAKPIRLFHSWHKC